MAMNHTLGAKTQVFECVRKKEYFFKLSVVIVRFLHHCIPKDNDLWLFFNQSPNSSAILTVGLSRDWLKDEQKRVPTVKSNLAQVT